MTDINEVKERFNSVERIHQDLREKKIRVESEIDTLSKDYNEKLKELLELTGAQTLEEAVKVYQDRRAQLDSEMEQFNSELKAFLDTYGEDGESTDA